MQATRELKSIGVSVSCNASGGHAALARSFFALSVQARPQLPARSLKIGDRDLKRGTRTFNFLWMRNFVLGRFWEKDREACWQ